ncbi:MAG: undecaprenyl/decaprenyl-phosphate alpha-N-acetylglucosaminyl 1-phosphate transferase [Anaerolineae bacterium]|nr:undecaprenyl/decaprenyl-phosphate alpha-N-acetylglucosaminyl 1-phosphate transferase [Anaerolineae bacterium]
MDALQFVPILVVGFMASLGLTPVSRHIAMRLGVVDKPSQRKIHHDHKPLMGGLAIYAAFVLSLVLFSPPQHFRELGAILMGATFLALVGLLDDRYNLGIRIRLVAMVLAAVGLILSGIQINLFNNPLVDIPLTILWVLTLTNATNFMDNMDGLTAGFCAIASTFFMLIAFSQGLTLVSSLAAAMVGSAVGFLIYNFNPSSVFMGDMGALVLGFVLSVLGIKLKFGTQPLNVTWMVPILVLALPLFDIALVVFTRLMEGRSPAQAGKDHTSHRLMSIGFSQRQTLFILYGACVLFGTLGVLVGAAPSDIALRVGAAGLIFLAILFVIMMWVRAHYQQKPLSRTS